MHEIGVFNRLPSAFWMLQTGEMQLQIQLNEKYETLNCRLCQTVTAFHEVMVSCRIL